VLTRQARVPHVTARKLLGESRAGASTDAEAPPRFPSPLIKPDVPISGIRLSDWLHRRLTNVVEHVEAVSRLVLRLAIQLDLKFPDLARCCQTHRQSPSLPSFTSTPEVRTLSSAGITRPHRSYGPLRLPDWPTPLLATFGSATPSQSRASPTDPDRLFYMPCSLPRWTGPGARWLPSGAFPRGLLPCPYSLPRFSGGSASTTSLSRPAQASHALRPARLLTHHSWALSRGSALAGFPTRTLASYQVLPTTT